MQSWVCLDASFVVTLILFPDHAAVQSLWQGWMQVDQQLVAPALIFFEVTNALYQYRRQNLLTEGELAIALAAVLALPIRIYTDVELHQKALNVAGRYGLPATYDAHYVALAQEYGADLWTTDRKLVNRCQQDWVRLVE
jgi:predicted nucleic acid-binding protein